MFALTSPVLHGNYLIYIITIQKDIYNSCSTWGLVHTRNGVSQKELMRGKTKLWVKNESICDWARPERTKDLRNYSGIWGRKKGGWQSGLVVAKSGWYVTKDLKNWEYLNDILKVSIHRKQFKIGHGKVVGELLEEGCSSGPRVDILVGIF